MAGIHHGSILLEVALVADLFLRPETTRHFEAGVFERGIAIAIWIHLFFDLALVLDLLIALVFPLFEIARVWQASFDGIAPFELAVSASQ